MTHDTRKAFKGFLLALAIIMTVSFLASIARADGAPQEAVENLEVMRANQKILDETREAHERFVQAKEDNERREQRNIELGWRTDWSTLELVPLTPRL